MNLITRWLLIAIVLSCTTMIHFFLRRHVEAAPPPAAMALIKPLEELTLHLDDWVGRELPEVEEMQYADAYLNRTYFHAGRRQSLTAWVIYTRDGSDRLHHPEICMAVSGIPEKRDARRTVALAGPGSPAQEFGYGQGADYQLVFYWHYMIWPATDKNLDAVQELYQRFHVRPESVTIQVFAPCQSVEDAVSARSLVKHLDLEIQSHVGPAAIRGNWRLPISNTNEI